MLPNLRPVIFNFGVSDESFSGFADGSKWNGFDNVRVEPVEARRIAAWLRSESSNEEADEILAIRRGCDGLISLAGGYATTVEEPNPDRCPDWSILLTDEHKADLRSVVADGWEDWTYGNDVCPRMVHLPTRLNIWFDQPIPEDREVPGMARYTLTMVDEEGSPEPGDLHETESWESLLFALRLYVEARTGNVQPVRTGEEAVKRAKLGAEYADLIGYDPFLDDASITIEEVEANLASYKRVVAEEEAGEFHAEFDPATLPQEQATSRVLLLTQAELAFVWDAVDNLTDAQDGFPDAEIGKRILAKLGSRPPR